MERPSHTVGIQDQPGITMSDKTVHWDPYLQHKQQTLLDSLPEEARDQTAFMFRTGNVASHFYNESEAEPTEEDFIDWLAGLRDDIARKFRQEGFEKHKTTAYESTKLLLFINDEKVVKTEDTKSSSLTDTKGIKTFYIGLLLALLFLTFLFLLPRFIRGTKESN